MPRQNSSPEPLPPVQTSTCSCHIPCPIHQTHPQTDFAPTPLPLTDHTFWTTAWPALASLISDLHEDLKLVGASLEAIHDALESQTSKNSAGYEINRLTLANIQAQMGGVIQAQVVPKLHKP